MNQRETSPVFMWMRMGNGKLLTAIKRPTACVRNQQVSYTQQQIYETNLVMQSILSPDIFPQMYNVQRQMMIT